MITRMDVLGGAQMHLMSLSLSLAEDGHDVFILYGGKRHKGYDVQHENITFISLVHLIHPLHAIEDVKAVQEVHQRFRELQPDIIALHSSKAGTIGRLAAKTLHIPTVFTAHGWAFTEGISRNKRRLYRLVEKGLATQTDAIIAVSHYDANLARRAHITAKKGLYVVHNGIVGMEQQKIVPTKNIVMVSRFQAPKRQDLVLEAFALLRTDLNVTLTLVGDGPLKAAAEQQAIELGIAERVHFAGDQQDVSSYLMNASVFVLMSDFEGLPISIIEAMAVGLPIVASDVGGVHELVKPGYNGYTIRNDAQELSKYLTKILTDDKVRKILAKQSRRLFEQSFQFRRTYQQTIAIYEQVRC